MTILPAPKLSRRRLLASAAATTALLSLGGCSPSPAAGRELVYGSATEPATLNPLLAPDISSRQAIDLVFDGLVSADESFQIVPRLAETWETSTDGRIWTFRLRAGVKFGDGSPLTTDDVVFTYQTIIDPQSGATLPRADYAAVDRVEAVDAQTVRFTLKRAYAPFLSRLTVGIVPKRALSGQPLASGDFNRKPIGTGPFALKEWTSGQRLAFAANASHFGGKPVVDRLVWQVVPDTASLSMQVLAGKIGGALIPDPEDRARIRADSRFVAGESFGGATQISLQLANPLFQDARVRQALALALDVPAIVDGVLRGEARLATSDIPPTSWAYDQTVQPLKHDADAASRLMTEAGYTRSAGGVWSKDVKPLRFTLLTYAGDRVREATLLAVQQQWKDFGVSVEIGTQERNSFVANRVLKGDFQAVLLESSLQLDPDLSRRFHSASIKAGQNFLNYQNPKVDALLDAANATTDRDARKKAYAETQRILLQDLPQIPLFHATQFHAFPAALSGIRPNAVGPFWNVASWMAK